MSTNFRRKCGLIVTAGEKGLDLSEMRIRFHTTQMDVDAPPTAVIRVFNLKDDTAHKVQNEFQSVSLQAGYDGGNYGVIFQGSIARVRRGREDATTTFVDVMASDLDEVYNFAVVSKTLAAGATPQMQGRAIGEAVAAYGGKFDASNLLGGTLPRGKVLFGLSRDRLSDLAETTNTTWSIQNGVVRFTSLTGYLAGEVTVLTSRTGLVGVPEATIDGVEAICLLNPNIKIGSRVQINNASINQTKVNQNVPGFPRYSDISFFADTTMDGFYRVLVVEHEGDTRGNEWYSRLTCLSLDRSAAPDKSVQAYG